MKFVKVIPHILTVIRLCTVSLAFYGLDLVVNAIRDRFEQPGYLMYKKHFSNVLIEK